MKNQRCVNHSVDYYLCCRIDDNKTRVIIYLDMTGSKTQPKDNNTSTTYCDEEAKVTGLCVCKNDLSGMADTIEYLLFFSI